MVFTDVQAAVTKTAVFNGAGLDISAITEDFTLVLEITKLTANAGQTPQVQFTFEDSVNAFTASVGVATYNQKGAVNQDGKQHGLKMTWRKRDLVGLRAGTASAVLRCSVAGVAGTGVSVDYKAYLQRVS
jgi:hypothetical protein